MKKFIFLFVFALTCVGAIAQSITLTFTGRDAKNQYVKLNRIVITNLTQNWQETIYYPDTILRMGGTSIDDFENANEFKLSQNVPNPFDGTTELALQMPEAGKVSLTVYDMNGKKVTAYHGKLAAGVHTFRVLLNTTQSYLLTARCGNEMATIKMVNNSGFGENAITYLGECKFYPPITTLKGGKGNTNNPFAFSDNMMYFGFATINGKEYTSDTIKKKQTVSESLILNFVINVCQPPIVTTVDISNITQNSVVCGGNVTCDGESVVTARGVCWNTSTTPTILGNHTTDSCGLGEFTSKISELAEGTTYHLRAYATNNAGTAYGDEKIFTTWSHCVAAPTVTDYDKNVYNTIQIGEQCWMRENLRTTKYADGTPIEKGNGTSNDVAILVLSK